MTSYELLLICAIIALATMIQVFATFKIVQIGTTALVNRIQELDGTLAEAITNVVESGLGSFEPPNPIVGIITEYMKQNLTPKSPQIAEMSRDSSGQFAPKSE